MKTQTARNNATLHNIKLVFNAAITKEAARLMNDAGSKAVYDYVGTIIRPGNTFVAIFSGAKKTRDELFGW